MDNLSHTLAGLVVAEAACERTGATATKRSLFFTASVLANNFPDLDLLYSDVVPAPIGYLLHHRGHTHTLGGAVVEVILILAVLALIPAFRRELADRSTLKGTTGVAAIGLLFHLMMDGWNSYGVHPLWPLSSRWFYGDAIFILEPFVWLGFAVPLMFLLKTKLVRAGIVLIIVGAPTAAFVKDLVSGFSLGALAIFGILLLTLAKHFASRRQRLFIAVAAVLFYVIVQLSAGAALRDKLVETFHPETPTHRILAVVSNPTPANPFCWHAIRIEVDPPRDYWRIIASADSLLPKDWTERVCPREVAESFTADGTLSDFRKAYDRDCGFRAWLRFARAPVLAGGRAFDARFAGKSRGNFTELGGAGAGRECPWSVPEWDHPRQDLIDLALDLS